MNRQQQIDRFLLLAHEHVAQIVASDARKIAVGHEALKRWRVSAGPTRSDALWQQWATLIDGPIDQLLQVMRDPGESANQLRQVSPFGALIDAPTRAQLLSLARAT